MNARRSLSVLFVTTIFAAGCSAGIHSETDKEHASPYLANATIGSIAVRAVRVVLPTAPPSNGAQAYLLATLVNSSDTPDNLVSATVGGGAVGAVATTGAVSNISLNLPAQQLVQLGDQDLGLTGQVLAVGALATPLQAGTTTTVTFTFATAGTTTVQAPVIDATSAGTTSSAAPVSAAG